LRDPRHDMSRFCAGVKAARRMFSDVGYGFAITADATDEISGIFAQALCGQNDAVAALSLI